MTRLLRIKMAVAGGLDEGMCLLRRLWRVLVLRQVCRLRGHKYGPWMFTPIRADMCWRCLSSSRWDAETRVK